MSYICKQYDSPANATVLRDYINTELGNMGWTAHDKFITFTSGGVHEIVATEVLTGATSGATATVTDVVLTSGTWAGGNAVGFLGVSGESGVFSNSENVNVPGFANSATIANGVQTVYKSNGEASDRIYEYSKMYINSSGNIVLNVYGYWNAATHAGLCASYGSGTLVWASSQRWIIVGSKDLVMVYKMGSIVGMFFGHIPTRYHATPLATTTGDASAGASVVISVDNVVDFIPAKTYIIYGAAGEGRDAVKVNAVGAGTLTIDSLPRNYATGAVIGAIPSTFGYCDTNTTTFYPTVDRDAAGVGGTGTGASSESFVPTEDLIMLSTIDPSGRLGAGVGTTGIYQLQPIYWIEAGTTYGGSPIGYDTDIFIRPPVGTQDTLYGVTTSGQEIDSGTATAATNTTLVCAGKSWTPDAYIDKIVLIASGTGAGQTRKITDNDATSLTVNTWTTNPAADSVFYIADEAYRAVPFFGTSYPLVYKEIL